MKTAEQLKAMNAAEQKAYAKEIGVSLQGNLKEEEIIKRIVARQAEPDFVDPEPSAQEPVELKKPEFEEPVFVMDNGTTHTAHEVTEAAQRDSGLTPEEWNKLPEEEIEETVQEFVDNTNFISQPAEEPVKTDKENKKRIEAIFADYPSVDYEIQDNFYTYSYFKHKESGNLSIPEQVLRRQLDVITNA